MTTIKITNNRYTAEALYQWDKNQTLEIYGLSLASAPEIHFTNALMACTIVRSSTMGADGVIRASVPNSLLQKPYKITAYVCICEGDSFKSQYEIIIPVKERGKPSDYTLEITDDEVYSFINLENKINDATRALNNATARIDSEIKKGVEESKTASANTITKLEEIRGEINTTLDEQNDNIEQNTATSNSALAIAKGKNQAHVFNTTEDMNAWLSSADNADKCSVGDNLYIVELDVPDWWITEVLTTADAETGFYYKIAQLETQKVDLSEVKSELNAFKSTTIQIVSFNAETGELVTQSPDYVAPEEV